MVTASRPSPTAPAGQATQPGMVFSGEQLSGVLSLTNELRSVTFAFDVAIPPPADPLSSRTTVA
jgi:hypothetical protein